MSTFLVSTLVFLSLGAHDDPPPSIGSAVSDFALADTQGKIRRLDDWRGSRLVVLAFVRADCPVAELYGTTLGQLAKDYGLRGVAFVGIATEGLDTPSDLDRFAKAHRIEFPILSDQDGHVAARLGARRTPEVAVLDEKRTIRYRGRIDNRYGVSSRRKEAARLDLVEAVEQLLSAKAVSLPQTDAVGCLIAQPRSVSSNSQVTYSRDIAPILNRRCVSCHRPGQIGPFALTNFKQASAWAGPILDAIEDGRMPPWHADPRFGQFANDCRLSDHEKALINAWVDGNAPEGKPAELPPPPSYPDGWSIPKPDVVVAMPESFAIPAQGVVDYQTFEVDPGFKEDTWIRASEIQPGNRKVVHHCTVFLKAPGSRDDYDTPGELGSFALDAMTPGSPLTLLDGMAKRIPAGWHLLFMVHYVPIGTPQVDRTRIGLVLADPRTVRKEVATNLLIDTELLIPPHDPDYRIEHSRRFEEDVLVLAMFPHMHLRGKSFRYEATYPDGRTEILLDVPRYDFRWQNRYELATPKRLPAGTTLRCSAHYDNSSNNPANPDPSAVVRIGKQSWDEMFNGYYDIVLADQDLTRPEPWGKARLRSVLTSYGRWFQVGGLVGMVLAGGFLMRARRAKVAGGA